MSRSAYDEGITNLAKNDWSGARLTPNQEQQVANFHIGIVMDDQDDHRMGRIWVYVPGFSTKRFDEFSLPDYGGTTPDRKTGRLDYDEKLRVGWVLCHPMLPYFGSDDFRVERAPDGRNAKKEFPNSYGMWYQPRIGDHVGIMFAFGEVAHAYWMGCIPKQYRNFAVPGQAGEVFDNIIDPVGDCPRDIYPAHEKYLSDEDPTFVPRKKVTDFSINLFEAALQCDVYRGSGISGARRESPSYVIGIKSPGWVYDSEKCNLNTDGTQFSGKYANVNTGGHQLVMDDHPDHQGVRLRTSFGSQIYMDDSCDFPYIFLNTPKGNMWMEMDDDGQLYIFCNKSFSVHAKEDINITADRDVSIEAQRDIRFLSRRDASIVFKGEVHGEFGENNLPPVCLSYNSSPDWGMGPEKDMFLLNFANLHWKIEDSYFLEVVNDWHITIGNDIFKEADNYNITLTQDLQIIGLSFDFTVLNEYNLLATDYNVNVLTSGKLRTLSDYNVTTGGGYNLTTTGTVDILSSADYKLTTVGTINLLTAGGLRETSLADIAVNAVGEYREQALVILMNSGAGPFAEVAGPADAPEFPSLPTPATDPDPPIVAELNTVWDCPDPPPDCCVDPPETDFLSYIVPQHHPYPETCKGPIYKVFSGFVEIFTDKPPVMAGSAVVGAEKPLAGAMLVNNAIGVYEAVVYATTSLAEAPQFTLITSDVTGIMDAANTFTELSEGMNTFLKRQEGLRLTPYPDAGGNWAVGYGHNIKIGDVINGETVDAAYIANLNRTGGSSLKIDQDEADRLFNEDVAKVTKVIDNVVTVPITQGQKDALTSFGYNVGTNAMKNSTMMAELNAGNFQNVPNEWMRWVNSDGEVNPVLQQRRQQELTRYFFKT